MLSWLVAAATALLVIAFVHFMRSGESPSQQAVRHQKRSRDQGDTAGCAELPCPPQMKPHRVYDDFEELFEALSGEGHKGLFVIVEDDVIPVFYKELDN